MGRTAVRGPPGPRLDTIETLAPLNAGLYQLARSHRNGEVTRTNDLPADLLTWPDGHG